MARTTNNTPSPLDLAVSTVRSWEAEASDAADAVTRWEAARPDSPADSPRIAQERVTSRERVRVAADALATAQEAETAARRALVAEEAERMAPEITSLQKDLDAHRARTAELLEPLREHTGRNWAPVPGPVAHRLVGDPTDPGTVTAPTPPERQLEARVELLQRRQDALRSAARSEEPACAVADLPDSLRVGGVLPVRAALDQAERDAAAKAEADHRAAEQAELDAAARAIGNDLVRAALRDKWNPLQPIYENGRPTTEELGRFRQSMPDGVTGAQQDALVTIARLVGDMAARRISDHLGAVAAAGARAPRSGWERAAILDKI